MSGEGAPSDLRVDGTGLRVGIVVARWHADITGAMLAGAQRALATSGVTDVAVVEAPGTFELPILAQALAAQSDAVVALGLVLRGGTPHFDFVCDAVTAGLTRVALDTGVPMGFGVLTCDTEAQARDRSGLPGSREDKGAEAALAAIATAVSLREVRPAAAAVS